MNYISAFRSALASAIDSKGKGHAAKDEEKKSAECAGGWLHVA
jgi:hypothetical protein